MNRETLSGPGGVTAVDAGANVSHPGPMRSSSAMARRAPEPEPNGPALGAMVRSAQEREGVAVERELIADERERIAEEREALADEREFEVDERERAAGQREEIQSEIAASEREIARDQAERARSEIDEKGHPE